jgi:hypothetical protein
MKKRFKMEKKTIALAVLAPLLATLTFIGGVKLEDAKVGNLYYCEAKSTVMKCDSFTVYYGLDNGKCINPSGNKLCNSGWIQITDIKQESSFNVNKCVEIIT